MAADTYSDNDPLSSALDEIPLKRLDEEGKPPEERLKKASALRSSFVQMRENDLINAHNRALCQGLLDGEPPYSASELAESNQPDTTNLNFQGAEQKLEQAKAPYYKLIHGSDVLLSVKTNFGPEEIRPEWETAIAEEFSKMIRRWDQFPYQTERLVHKHVWEGVGFAHWPDDTDWRPQAGGLGQFYFPRQTAATESAQEIICVFEEYSLTRLYGMIKNPESAAKAGWDVKAVRLAINKATSTEPAWQDWERLMEEIKNNDLSCGSKLPKVNIIHGFVAEFGGKISHYMTTEEDCGEDFIYKKAGAFESMTEAVVMFPYSTGTNNKLHGIRGLGYKIYPFEQQRNRSIGRLIDKGYEASSTMVQAEDEESLEKVGLEYLGNLAVLQPGIKLIKNELPDLQRSVIPAIDLMDRLGSERTASYSSANVFQGDQRKTKAEVMAHLEQSAALTDTSMDFFYGPWRRVLQQIVRRAKKKTYRVEDPGGKEIKKMRDRLEARGVPLEALYALDHEETMEMRVIGGGSSAAKSVALVRMGEMYGRMDDVGKKNYDRDVAVDTVGQSNANRYFPANQEFRTTDDTQIAILQNYHLLQGQPCPVLSTDMHLAHAREHLKPLMEMYQAVEAGQADIAQVAPQNQLLFAHASEHVEAISGDEASIEEANAMRQMLQRIGEIIFNGMKEAERQQQEQAEGGGEGAESEVQNAAGAAKVEAEMQALMAKAQLDLRLKEETNAVMNRIKEENAIQERAIKDANAAAEIARQGRKTRAKKIKEQTPPTP